MSQIQSFLESAGPGPGPVLSLTGDIGGAVGPNGGGTIFVHAEGIPSPAVAIPPTSYVFGSVQGDPATNTLNIAPFTAVLTTNNAAPTVIYSLGLPSNTAAIIRASVIAVNSDFSVVAGGDVISIGRNPGGTGVVETTGGSGIVTDYMGNPPPTCFGFANGNNLEIIVSGVNGQTWNWTVAIQYLFELL